MTTIQYRRGTAAAWTSANPVLASGEPGFETDTGKFKIGDGVTAWTSLAYFGAAADVAAHLADTSDAHDASAVSFAPTGGLAATDVQAALSELDSEKMATARASVLVYRTTNLSLTHDTVTVVPFDAEVWDTDGYHNTSTNPSRITVPAGKAGRYLLQGSTQHAASSGMIQTRFHKNGGLLVPNGIGSTVGAAGGIVVSHNALVDLAVGDYVELYTYQASGGTANLTSTMTSFAATLLGT